MKFELPPLPYAFDALEPQLSARTLGFHYDEHHRGYLNKLRGLIEGTPEERLSLADLVTSSSGAIFENAAQVWNHDFYWQSMKPGGGGTPHAGIRVALEREFGSLDAFRTRFIDTATRLFGSGYLWLSFDPRSERVLLEGSANAANPLLVDRVPLIGMDVWEHAYYLDYQNARDCYAGAFLQGLVNWDFAEENLEKAR